MAATLTSRRVQAAFDGGRARAFLYGHSFCGNPLGAAVAREVLAVYRDERVIEGVPARAEVLRDLVARVQGDPSLRGLVRDARALGVIAAFDLRDGGADGYTASIGWRVYDEARRRGAYLRPLGNVVYLTPALNVPLDDLGRLAAIVEESLRAVVAG